jgi:hypothetical protein
MDLVTFVLPTSFKSTENDQWTDRKKKIKKWRYEEQMQFLKPHFQERETSTNVGDEREKGAEDDEAEGDDAETPPATSPASSTLSARSFQKKRNTPNADLAEALTSFIETRRVPKAEADSPHNVAKKKLMTFMDDICESIMKFPELDQAEIKREIFNLVNKREIEILRRRANEELQSVGTVQSNLHPSYNQDARTGYYTTAHTSIVGPSGYEPYNYPPQEGIVPHEPTNN